MPAPTAATTRLAIILTGAIVLALLGACATEPVLPEGVTADSAEGIYISQCARCHDPERVGARSSITTRASPSLADKKHLSGLGKDYLRKIIAGGGELVGRSKLMPAAEGVNPAQLEKLIDYLLAGKG